MKKVLLIIPFENIYPPVNGGMHRCLHILNQLAKYFDVSLIMHQSLHDFLKAVNEFPLLGKVKLYSTYGHKNKKDFFSLLPRRAGSTLRTRWLMRSWKTSADGSLLKYHGLLKTVLKRDRYNIIVLENLSTLNAVSLIRRYNGDACIIYDAHNIDSNLATDKLERGMITNAVFERIKEKESSLHKTVDGMIACSRKDLEGYEELNKAKLRAAIIPNGVKLFDSLKDESVIALHPSTIIFCGALNYYPNVEGLLWFYNSVWPLVKNKLPFLKLIVIGSGHPLPALAPLQNDPAISFEGRVADVKEYYNKAAVSIVPLKQGSGTRLKILEAMSLGVPVIATSKGAEGIEYKNGHDIVIADGDAEFAQQLVGLVTQKEARMLLQKNARLLVKEKYDWDVIGKGLREFIEKTVCN